MDSAQVGVLKETHQVSLSSLLESQDSVALETKVGLEVLSNFPHQSLERELPDQQLGTLLVLANFTTQQQQVQLETQYINNKTDYKDMTN